MTEYVKAWQCIGCGRIEAPQNCLGVCKDRKVEFVYAGEYETLRKELAAERARSAALALALRQIVSTEPRNGEWERCYRALQAHANKALKRGEN